MREPLFRTRIKICGMTEPELVKAAVELGVDAVGMILHADSPRQITLEQASKIREKVPAFVSLVGVFVDAEKSFIEQAIDQVGLDLVQLHGSENDNFGASLSRPFIKAIRARTSEQVRTECNDFPSAQALLLDPYVEGQHGGTGQKLDAQLWPTDIPDVALVLAGGLSANNVAGRVSSLSPYAVDLNSGLEGAPGVKRFDLMRRAINSIHAIDASQRDS